MCRPKDLDETEDVHDETDTESDSEDSEAEEAYYVDEWENVLELRRRGEIDRAIDLTLSVLRQYRMQYTTRSVTIRRLRAHRNRRREIRRRGYYAALAFQSPPSP